MSDNKRYVDMMDRTRMVQVVSMDSDPHGNAQCRVYFKDTGYAGNVDIPRSLFTETPFDKDGRPTLLGRIGFAPVGTKARED